MKKQDTRKDDRKVDVFGNPGSTADYLKQQRKRNQSRLDQINKQMK